MKASSLTLLIALSSFKHDASPVLVEGIGDWTSNWQESERTLDAAFEMDPLDDRSVMRGSGEIVFGNSLAKFKGSPRLYISNGADRWKDVEIVAYGNYKNKGSVKSYSGLTLVARSNHDNYKNDGCDAFSYYARIYLETGECAFQKEYFHGSSTVYSASKRVDCFVGGLPMNQWVGMKFRVTTVPSTSNVQLELYLDQNDSGTWELKHEYLDEPGSWPSTKYVPSQCPHDSGDTVLGAGNVCFLRTDGSSSTEVHWRDASITNQGGSPAPPSTDAPAPNPTPSVSLNLVIVTKEFTCCLTSFEKLFQCLYSNLCLAADNNL